MIPGLGRSPREGHGNPLQYSYLENPMDRGAWQATVHGITQNWTQLTFSLSQILKVHLGFIGRRQWHPTPVLLPGKSHGWRSLVGCSPWGREESDKTEQLHFHFSLSCIGEGNGNPLQCSCLEIPRDGGAWWAAVYGVTQSRTRLKRQQQQQQQPVACWLLCQGRGGVLQARILACIGQYWLPYPSRALYLLLP